MSARESLHALVERYGNSVSGPGIDARANAHSMDRRWQVPGFDVAQARNAAVLMLFGPLDDSPSQFHADAVPDDLDVLLVERAGTLSSHAGQVAFPGGRMDEGDAGPVDAALREAREETGLDPAGVEVLGTFPGLPLPVSNHVVIPVLAWWAAPSPVAVVDYGESANVFRIPVADLLNPANRVTAVARKDGHVHRSPGFTVNGTLVWGFTGLLLDRVLRETGWLSAVESQTPAAASRRSDAGWGPDLEVSL
ncbi:NUDIX hydrolase [Arthrobacter roseus]|uniref:NUDIX hydrolase n=1 Tax=Arthrobacter roseus TaxID=136274 RepID=UPI001964F65D|nr:CoA pyrophosphatase [Arthrobacter roseus]MBM7849553.1 8-oxo-dGTP pyrophosphatase MutT (NUDIX family) [Arthrobacter roseus]